MLIQGKYRCKFCDTTFLASICGVPSPSTTENDCIELMMKWNENPHNKISHLPPTRGEKRKLYGLETEARGVSVFRSKLINESKT